MFFAHRIIEMSNCAPAAVRRGAGRLGAKGVGGMRFTKTLRFRLIVVTVLCTGVAPSIHGGDPVLAFVRPIQGLGSRPGQGYLYLELQLALFDEVLAPYADLNTLFIATGPGTLASALPQNFPEEFTAAGLVPGQLCEIGGAQYQVTGRALGGLTLYHCALQTALDQEGLHIVYTVATVLALSLLLAVCLAVLTSAYFSRPVSRLNARLRRIAANDFSFDPEIEKPQDELGQIGRTVNEMSMSIQHLLQDAADYVCISPGYLSALFKKQYNQNFVDYINEVKTNRACELIREGKYRICEISYMLGFENAYYFTRVFKRHTGMTPTEYQKQLLHPDGS